jgi:ligand-binding sensor domain-containing protein/AraC-like DNA-binding protein
MTRVITFYLLLTGLFIRHSEARETAFARFNISYITVDDGLPTNFIDDIYKDGQGFLWVSTSGGGLARYDGFEFMHFTIASSPVRLAGNFVNRVVEDRFNRLWIATENGLNILDKRLMQLTWPQDEQHLFDPEPGQPVVNIISDTQGAIWIFSGTTLRKIVFNETGGIADVLAVDSLPRNVYTLAMADIDADGNIWTGTANRLSKVLPANEPRRLYLSHQITDLPMRETSYISTFVMKENELWIGTNEDGLIRYNLNSGAWNLYRRQETNPHSLTHNNITDLAVTHDHRLLVGTLRGINIYQPISDNFEHLTLSGHTEDKSLNSDFINCLLVDGERLWIGTETGGLNTITPLQLHAHNFTHVPNRPASLSRNPVNAIFEDNSGHLWVGTVEGGLNKRIDATDNFIHYTTAPPANLCHNSISALATDNDGRLWVGTWGNGVTLLDMQDPNYRKLRTLNNDTNAGLPHFVGLLCYDSINQGMWIGGNPGIFFYDLKTDRLLHPLDSATNQHARGCIGAITDRQGRLWVGTMEGVFRIDLRARSGDHFPYIHFRYKPDDPESGRVEWVTCFCMTADGTLWVGSNSYGIYKYLPATDSQPERFVNYNNEHGLINNTVRGILSDRQDRLWISTINGLSCFDPEAEAFINYTTEDGLPNNHFYWNACCKTRDGHLFFGGLQGMTSIEPDMQNTEARPAQVKLTRLFVAEKEIHPGNRHIDCDISMAHTLTLHESDKSFALKFSSLTYEPRPASAFSYRLLGFNEQWIDVHARRRFATYTNLPAGVYTFQVRYNAEGNAVGDNPVTELRVVIHPYFYKTWWFASLLLLTAAFSIAYLWFSRVRRLEKQKELLHRMVEERTSELMQQNVRISRQEEQLEEMSRQVEGLRQQAENANDRKFLDKANALMKEHYADADYTQAEFFAMMGISKSAANKRFRSLTGMSVGEFIRHYRLSVAFDLIKENSLTRQMNISDIAYAVGFNDPKYFSRCFMKRYEITPTQLMTDLPISPQTS